MSMFSVQTLGLKRGRFRLVTPKLLQNWTRKSTQQHYRCLEIVDVYKITKIFLDFLD